MDHFFTLFNKIEKPEYNSEKVKALESFGLKYKNPIKIVEKGEYTGVEEVKSKKVGSKEFFLENCKSYLSGPIFTDDFHEDHHNRRIWEDDVEEKIKKSKKEKDIYNKYYKKNRLGVNSYFQITNALDLLLLEDLDEEPELREKMVELDKELNTSVSFLIKKENDILVYNTLKDHTTDSLDGKEGKVEIIERFSDIVRKAISILEKKS